jgi:hypothetical protein
MAWGSGVGVLVAKRAPGLPRPAEAVPRKGTRSTAGGFPAPGGSGGRGVRGNGIGLARPGHEGPSREPRKRLVISHATSEPDVGGDMRSCSIAHRGQSEHRNPMRRTRKKDRP